MQAIVVTAHGGPEVLAVRDVPDPVPTPGSVLIRVESAGVNFSDVMRRRGSVYPFPTAFPWTPGSEVAGTVEAVGAGVDWPAIGSPVVALVGADGSGGYAQFAVADARQVFPLPAGLTPDAAAGLTVAGVSARLMLVDVAGVRPGETVLVEGAAGGVGRFAVQTARALGARVIGAAGSPERRAAALAAGADEVVDYTREGWADEVLALTGGRGADVVLHVAGGSTFTGALSALAPFGRLVVAGTADGTLLTLGEAQVRSLFYDPARNQSLLSFNLGLFFGLRPEAAGRALGELLGDVAAGRVVPAVGTVLPLSQAAQAHGLLEHRSTPGRIVLSPWS